MYHASGTRQRRLLRGFTAAARLTEPANGVVKMRESATGKSHILALVCHRQHYAIFQSAATKANPRLASAVKFATTDPEGKECFRQT